MMLLVGLPLLVVNYDPGPGLYALDALGVFIWVVGFFFEAVGDYQLDRFIARKKSGEAKKSEGRIMKTGLWRYTRHPNYFGEAAMWWGIFFIAVSAPLGYVAVISPLLISFLLLRVSGIPMLEKKYEKDAEFQKYAKKTSSFFPLPPKK